MLNKWQDGGALWLPMPPSSCHLGMKRCSLKFAGKFTICNLISPFLLQTPLPKHAPLSSQLPTRMQPVHTTCFSGKKANSGYLPDPSPAEVDCSACSPKAWPCCTPWHYFHHLQRGPRKGTVTPAGLAPGLKSLCKVTWEAVGSQKWVISMLPTQYSVTKPSCHCSQECSFFSTTVSLISIEIKCMYVIEFLCHILLWDFPSILIVTKFELTAHICT